MDVRRPGAILDAGKDRGVVFLLTAAEWAIVVRYVERLERAACEVVAAPDDGELRIARALLARALRER